MRAALALGSGGARGYAHIGVIQVLEERGVEIVAVAGSSMGAFVGGLYAAGRLDDCADSVRALSQFDLLRLLDVSVAAPGVIRAEKVFARVHELVGGLMIEDLPVAYTAVATDLYARKAVWLQRGSLELAMRASVAIPGVFTPVPLNGQLLVDGGLIDPVPMAPIASISADMTIAVDLAGERSERADAPSGTEITKRAANEWTDRLWKRTVHLVGHEPIRSVMSRFDRAPDSAPRGDGPTSPGGGALESLPAGLSKFEMMNQSLETMQCALTSCRLAANPPDVLIRIPKDACRTLDFARASHMIELGRALTIEALDGSAPASFSL
ncbi:MAG: patatin-like phospholipase family protein [Acidimicrobiales bacterium]|jgi:NTE family protein